MQDQVREDSLSHLLKRVEGEIAESTPLAAPPSGAGRRLHLATWIATRARRARYRFGLGVAVAVAVTVPLLALGVLPGNTGAHTTVHVRGLAITLLSDSQASPQMTAQQAVTIAVDYLDQQATPLFTGYSSTASSFEPGVLNVVGQCVNMSFTVPQTVWLVEASAPPQLGYSTIRGIVLVDDDSGKVSLGAVLTETESGTGGGSVRTQGTVTSGASSGGPQSVAMGGC
jgi:hypothetical protein